MKGQYQAAEFAPRRHPADRTGLEPCIRSEEKLHGIAPGRPCCGRFDVETHDGVGEAEITQVVNRSSGNTGGCVSTCFPKLPANFIRFLGRRIDLTGQKLRTGQQLRQFVPAAGRFAPVLQDRIEGLPVFPAKVGQPGESLLRLLQVRRVVVDALRGDPRVGAQFCK